MNVSSFSPSSVTVRERRQLAAKLEAELPGHREGELLVRLKPGLGFAGSPLDRLGGQVLHRFQFPRQSLVSDGDGEMLHIKLPEGTTTAEGLLTLEGDPRVSYATPNHILDADETLSGNATTPNDLDKRQWAMQAIHAPEAWAITHGSKKGPIIAVLDSGADVDHPDIKPNLWTNPREIPGNGLDDDHNGYVDDVHGINPAKKNGDLSDSKRHGSHTFGIIGAAGNNGLGVTGLNWEGRIMVIKILDEQGHVDAASVIKGMEYAAKNGARITNNSWGGKVFNPAILDAFKSCPALHIVAAGNDSVNNDSKPQYPADFDLPNIISVASSERNDHIAGRSNYGFNSVDLAAPGWDILSTVPGGGYDFMSGTSMAAPHVTGAAGLIASEFPHASDQEIKDRIICSTDKVEALKGKVASGGRLNVASALEVDTLPPADITNLAVKGADSRGVNLQWVAPGDDGKQGTASLYEVRYSDQPITPENFAKATRTVVDPPRQAGTTENLRVDLPPDAKVRKLFLGVKAFDNVGNSTPIAGVSAQLPASRLVFTDQGESSFTHDGEWAQVNLPGEGLVWTDSPAGDYKENQTTSLTTRPFSLQGIKNSTVLFDAKVDLARDNDRLWLQASNNGKDWNNLRSFQTVHPWESHSLDLSKFDGEKNVQFRFSLATDGSGNKDGVYVKNISVVGDS